MSRSDSSPGSPSLRAPPTHCFVVKISGLRLGDAVDICFTVIAVFVNGHRYVYNRDSSNYYEGHRHNCCATTEQNRTWWIFYIHTVMISSQESVLFGCVLHNNIAVSYWCLCCSHNDVHWQKHQSQLEKYPQYHVSPLILTTKQCAGEALRP